MSKKLLVIESCSGCPKFRVDTSYNAYCTAFGNGGLMERRCVDRPGTIPDWCPLPDAAPSAREAGDPTINDDGISKDDLIGGNS